MRKPGYIALVVLMAATIALTGFPIMAVAIMEKT